MPSNLYIIGNGFDRYHELGTSYHAFAFFLKRNYEDLYELIIRYYGLPDLNPNDPKSHWEPLWADFENGLADLDTEAIVEDKSDYLANISADDFSDRDWYAFQNEIENIVDNLTSELCKAFKKFILNIEYPESVDNRLLQLERDSTFLSFNYTETLEKYYYIKSKNILHIHGYAQNSSEELILGHGIDPATFEEKKITTPEGLSEDELTLWREEMADEYDFSYENGKNELMRYFSTSFKYSADIIRKHESFFSKLSKLEKVIVLGHSLASVDEKYFIKVIRSTNRDTTQWIVSYYSDEERKSHINTLKSLGLKAKQIKLIKIEELKLKEPTLFD